MILGKRMRGKRTKTGSRVYKVIRKRPFKRKIATVSAVKKMIMNNSEIKHVTGSGEGDVNQFAPRADTTLPSSRIQPMSIWPGQGDNSYQRDGKIIKNVTQAFRIKFIFYITQQKATQTAGDLIPYHTWRVILWTAKQDVVVGSNCAEFFRMNSNSTNGIDLVSINKTKITVIKDKVYNIPNIHYHPGSTPLNSVQLSKPVCAVRYLTAKRRWKQINFPTNNSNEPSKSSNYTFMSILPYGVNTNFVAPDTIETNKVGFWNLRTITYFTD